MCRIVPATAGTCGPVKHPDGDFQRPVRPTASETASKHRHTRFVDHLMDIKRSAKPRVPSIKDLAPVDNVGVLAFGCTITSDPTPPMADNLQPWSTSKELKPISRCRQ
jgi:hypothetical protein